MRLRVVRFAAILLGAAVLGGVLLWPKADYSRPVAVDPPVVDAQGPGTSAGPPVREEPVEASIESETGVQTPVDVATRERFNEDARAFFAGAGQMIAEERVREAQRLEQELARIEQAGGISAGETLLIRAGLIRSIVPAGAQQDAQLQALQQRYTAETQLRVAAAQARPDPQFESYKVRESEIVNEVMAMETIPDGLTRDEYLRQRLQSAREQLTPQ